MERLRCSIAAEYLSLSLSLSFSFSLSLSFCQPPSLCPIKTTKLLIHYRWRAEEKEGENLIERKTASEKARHNRHSACVCVWVSDQCDQSFDFTNRLVAVKPDKTKHWLTHWGQEDDSEVRHPFQHREVLEENQSNKSQLKFLKGSKWQQKKHTIPFIISVLNG